VGPENGEREKRKECKMGEHLMRQIAADYHFYVRKSGANKTKGTKKGYSAPSSSEKAASCQGITQII